MNAMKRKRPGAIKHGYGSTPTYRSWYSMLERCRNPSNASFRFYGARGIHVCERWHNIVNFVDDMGVRPVGMTLDRVNGEGDYEPGNCRWATEIDQQRTKRSVRCSIEIARRIRAGEFAGMQNKEIAAMFGFDPSTVSRIKSGEAWVDAQ